MLFDSSRATINQRALKSARWNLFSDGTLIEQVMGKQIQILRQINQTM